MRRGILNMEWDTFNWKCHLMAMQQMDIFLLTVVTEMNEPIRFKDAEEGNQFRIKGHNHERRSWIIGH